MKMNEMIKQSPIGDEYERELLEVIKIRAQRRKIYGDDFSHPMDVEVWHIYQKTFRMLNLFKSGNVVYEKLEDTLRDIINYSLFLLIKIRRKKKVRTKIKEIKR